ncbi:MAG: 4-alpha-glucanotransferase, partial [Cyanobacteria bacterium HKST-UBA03]|nr:4-alpha-glucanotransferase [Cyanobacteria bacterium HKST-UBA03]
MISQLNPALQELASHFGIGLEYADVWGNHHQVPQTTLMHLLKSMGVDATQPEKSLTAVREAYWLRMADPVAVVPETADTLNFDLRLAPDKAGTTVAWVIQEENGFVHEGQITLPQQPHELRALSNGQSVARFQIQLPLALPLGYHTLSVATVACGDNQPVRSAMVPLIVTPSACYLPESMRLDNPQRPPQKTWGPAIQLYSLRSRHNWGIGDFTDLAMLLDWCHQNGSGVVGLNPLHALFSHNPSHISPYSPTSRTFYNGIYLDVEAIDDYAECQEARAFVQSERTQSALGQADKSLMVQYETVQPLKLQALVLLYESFRKNHLEPETKRGQAFKHYVEGEGELLKRFALYEALQDELYAKDQNNWGWPVWPHPYQSPDSPMVKEFEAQNQQKIGFFLYIQWQIHLQLSALRQQATDTKMPVGLYMDLAVGVDKGGVDTWSNQSLYALDVCVGCPPDELNQKGQNWGLPPMIPQRLKEQGYKPFITMLRHNMRYAGALRLDHAMALMRLFWIPDYAQSAADGAYVAYPLDDLMGILALESQRNQCLIIGEDLGTVPDAFRHHMDDRRILSYKVFFFERKSQTEYKTVEDYPRQALVTTSTHDIPTLNGFWQGEDNAVRDKLDLFPNDEMRKRLYDDRTVAKQGILNLLAERGLLPEGVSQDAGKVVQVSYPLNLAIHRFLSQTPSLLQMIQLEDVLEQIPQANMPGTVDEH